MNTAWKRRVNLARRCRDPSLRITGRNLDVRNKWSPYGVKEPDTGMKLSDGGAWDYIADCLLDKSVRVKDLPNLLEDPPIPAVYFEVYDPWDERKVYVKIGELGDGKVLGVSFHHSTREYQRD